MTLIDVLHSPGHVVEQTSWIYTYTCYMMRCVDKAVHEAISCLIHSGQFDLTQDSCLSAQLIIMHQLLETSSAAPVLP